MCDESCKEAKSGDTNLESEILKVKVESNY